MRDTAHAVKWRDWASREESERRHGVGEIRATAKERE